MTIRYVMLTACVWLIAQGFSMAQDASDGTSNSSVLEETQTLDQQYRHLKKKSETFKEYKVIKETRLNSFWGNVMDSVQATKSELRATQQTLSERKAEVQSLNQLLAENQKLLEEKDYESSRISVLGMYVPKNSYVSIIWGVILTLIVLLGIAIAKFQNSNKSTTRIKADYQEINQEFDEFKKRAREKEIKLKRELQTELNTVEELKRKLPLSRA